MSSEKQILRRLGTRIRELRKVRNLSQEALAAVSGLDRTYIGGIERGERNVAIRNLVKISRALGVPVSELVKDI
jgi:transcriptional regulator with XRE-family HTH domain